MNWEISWKEKSFNMLPTNQQQIKNKWKEYFSMLPSEDEKANVNMVGFGGMFRNVCKEKKRHKSE